MSYQQADGRLVILQGCRTIPLTQGFFTLVDESDFFDLPRAKYHVAFNGWGESVRPYARCSNNGNPVLVTSLLLKPPKGIRVDHRSGDSLDNTRDNLRPATSTQNNRNRRIARGRDFKGIVRVRSRVNPWAAKINVDKKSIHLGCFSSAEAAARAYDAAALRHFGEFARLNFVLKNVGQTDAGDPAR